jgi:hypothetical protein
VSTVNGDYSISWNFGAGALQAWTHVAGTYDGITLRLFANGAQVAQGNGTGAIQNRGGVLRIGNGDQTVAGGEAWNGEIDEVRIWPFARPAAAIAAAMGQRLQSLPGEVSTWNLDGDGTDSSGSNHGAGVGGPVFAVNTLAQQVVSFPGVLNFGNASGCRTTGIAAVPALANLGSNGFGFVATRAPANAGGFAVVSTSTLPSPLTILGVQAFVNPSAAVSTFLIASPIGTSSVGLPVPNVAGFLGIVVFAQFAWLDPTCPNGVSASNGVLGTVLP